MGRLSQTAIIKKLNSEELSLLTVADFKRLFAIEKDNTAYKIIERLVKKGLLKQLTKGRYAFTLLAIDDFQMANFLYPPSYISLESALSFYGLMTQFPYQVTSITTKKTKTLVVDKKEFAYFHLQEELFLGYEKKDRFLMALPEKALFDYLYFCAKGLRKWEKDEFDLKRFDKKLFLGFVKRLENQKIKKFLKRIKL